MRSTVAAAAAAGGSKLDKGGSGLLEKGMQWKGSSKQVGPPLRDGRVEGAVKRNVAGILNAAQRAVGANPLRPGCEGHSAPPGCLLCPPRGAVLGPVLQASAELSEPAPAAPLARRAPQSGTRAGHTMQAASIQGAPRVVPLAGVGWQRCLHQEQVPGQHWCCI